MVHYAVVNNGRIIGNRSSAGHTSQVYTHAVTVGDAVLSFHSSEALAAAASRTSETAWSAQRHEGRVTVLPVITTDKKLKVGTVVLREGDTLLVTKGQVLRHLDADGKDQGSDTPAWQRRMEQLEAESKGGK